MSLAEKELYKNKKTLETVKIYRKPKNSLEEIQLDTREAQTKICVAVSIKKVCEEKLVILFFSFFLLSIICCKVFFFRPHFFLKLFPPCLVSVRGLKLKRQLFEFEGASTKICPQIF